MTDWTEICNRWSRELGASLHRPAPADAIAAAEAKLGPLPEQLKRIYEVTNGIWSGWFVLYPVEDQAYFKRTWDGLCRHNEADRALHFAGDKDLYRDFLVIASIGDGFCAAIERKSGAVWVEDANGVAQAALSIRQFIQASLIESYYPGVKPEDPGAPDIGPP